MPSVPALRVLFVCSVNTCRSPMAMTLANELLWPGQVHAESAGTDATLDRLAAPVSPLAQQAANARIGFDKVLGLRTHRTRSLTPARAQGFTVVALSEAIADKCRAIGVTPAVVLDVEDPISERSIENYQRTCGEIEKQLRSRHAELGLPAP